MSVFHKGVAICVEIDAWGGDHSFDQTRLGGAKLSAEYFRKGGVKLLPKEHSKKIHAKSQALRDHPKHAGGFKLESTSSVFLIPDALWNKFMYGDEEAGKKGWEQKLADYNAVIAELQENYDSIMRQQLKEIKEDLIAKNPDIDRAIINELIREFKAAYPAKESLPERLKARLLPSKTMALLPTREGEEFLTELDKKGAEARNKLIRLAKLDEAEIELAHKITWCKLLVDRLSALKKVAEGGEDEKGKPIKIKGHQIKNARFFLRDHILSNYFGDDKIIGLMQELIDILPESDYASANEGSTPQDIYNKIVQIERKIGTEENKTNKKLNTLAKRKRRMVRF